MLIFIKDGAIMNVLLTPFLVCIICIYGYIYIIDS